MKLVLLPRPRWALRHPGIQAGLGLLVLGPLFVAFLGSTDDSLMRLRLLGILIAATAALAWDERSHELAAPTPTGLPAVRRGRAVAQVGLLGAAWGAGCWTLAATTGAPAPFAAMTLQLAGLAALIGVLIGWFGRDGDPVVALPFPAVMFTVVLLNRLPHQIALMRAEPGSAGWPQEQLRWWVLLAGALLLLARLNRDPGTR